MTLRVGIIQIGVTDLGEAWSFYVNKLGFRGKESLGVGKAFEIETERGPTILIYPVREIADRRYPDATGITVVFHTENIAAQVANWRAKDVEFIPIEWAKDESGIANSPFGPFIAFRDPFGNVHELVQPPGGQA